VFFGCPECNDNEFVFVPKTDAEKLGEFAEEVERVASSMSELLNGDGVSMDVRMLWTAFEKRTKDLQNVVKSINF